jgi:hypothetical protein
METLAPVLHATNDDYQLSIFTRRSSYVPDLSLHRRGLRVIERGPSRDLFPLVLVMTPAGASPGALTNHKARAYEYCGDYGVNETTCLSLLPYGYVAAMFSESNRRVWTHVDKRHAWT